MARGERACVKSHVLGELCVADSSFSVMAPSLIQGMLRATHERRRLVLHGHASKSPLRSLFVLPYPALIEMSRLMIHMADDEDYKNE